MLGLSASAPVIEDKPLGARPRQLRAEVHLDHPEYQIDSRGHAGRSPDRAVSGVDEIFFDPNPGVASAQVWREEPVSRGAAPVEHSSFGQHEGTGAN